MSIYRSKVYKGREYAYNLDTYSKHKHKHEY